MRQRPLNAAESFGPPARRFTMNFNFDNSFVRELPADPDSTNRRRQIRDACFSRVEPTRVAAPRLVAHAREVAELLEIDPADVESEEFASVFSGNTVLPGMATYAACYGGHQFGNWAGQLGDGRAITLGEVVNSKGERWEMQLKGAGPTPYSRTADGRAVMRSSVREFLCSEAMHHLGVPTTRALSLVATGESVVRDMFYDGNPQPEPGAVVCRVAPSFLRFGNFEILNARKETDLLAKLADYAIRTHFPDSGPASVATYVRWFEEVCRRTASMIADWMRVGFVHGVMNTDNMSVLGLTIDYGPYGWLDNFDPDWTPNTTDAGGRRYRYGHQPNIAHWNLVRFANAIYPLVGAAEPLREALNSYGETFVAAHREAMARKLGLSSFRPGEDEALVEDLNDVLTFVETDMTIFYRKLADVAADVEADASIDADLAIAPIIDAYYEPDSMTADQKQRIAQWLLRYKKRLKKDVDVCASERRAKMNAVNPKYVLRNYLAQLAIDEAERGDSSLVARTLDVMRKPYDEQPENEKFAAKRPDWARERAGCSMLSCSS
jgi:uncharacterized protein YdiU (UPF0061 family)